MKVELVWHCEGGGKWTARLATDDVKIARYGISVNDDGYFYGRKINRSPSGRWTTLEEAQAQMQAVAQADMAMRIPSECENPDGLYQRYTVTKRDGTMTDPRAVYFVLRLDSHGDDPAHIMACRAAAYGYCDHILRHDYNQPLAKMATELQELLTALRDVPFDSHLER